MQEIILILAVVAMVFAVLAVLKLKLAGGPKHGVYPNAPFVAISCLQWIRRHGCLRH
jgi:hypothetical protein